MKLTKPQMATLEKIAEGPALWGSVNATVRKSLLTKDLIEEQADSTLAITEAGRALLAGGSETGGNVAERVPADDEIAFTTEQDTAVLAAELPTADEIGYVGQEAAERLTHAQLMAGQRFHIEDTEGPKNPQQTGYGVSMLFGLDNGKHIYGGTANRSKVNRRRAKNRVASKSRKANRRG